MPRDDRMGRKPLIIWHPANNSTTIRNLISPPSLLSMLQKVDVMSLPCVLRIDTPLLEV